MDTSLLFSDESAELLQVFFTLGMSTSWDVAQQTVENHPDLLTDRADALWEQVIAHARSQNSSFEKSGILYRGLLQRCREVGVATAFAERAVDPDPFLPWTFSAIPILKVQKQLIVAKTWEEAKEIVETYPELLTDRADQLMEQQVIRAREIGLLSVAERIGAYRALLRRSRKVDITTALAERSIDPCRHFAWTLEPNSLLNVLRSFLLAKTWEEAHSIVASHPELLTDRADKMLEQMLIGARKVGLLRIKERLEIWHALLRRCRETNITTAFEEKTPTSSGPPSDIDGDLLALMCSRQAGNLRPIVEWARHFVSLHAETLKEDTEGRRFLGALLAETGHMLLHMEAGDRAEDFELAIDFFKQALAAWTRDAFPQAWATVHNGLASAYNGRIYGDRADNIEWAIHHGQQALEVRTFERSRADWAETQNNLAAAYLKRIREVPAENLAKAIEHSRLALKVFTRAAYPEEWAGTHSNLAIAFSLLSNFSDHARNIERAIHHGRRALRGGGVRESDQSAFSFRCRFASANLANAYIARLRGKRSENLEIAIGLLEEGLKAQVREVSPETWAKFQYNLGRAYQQRIHGNRADNLKRAINHYRQALESWTSEQFPLLHLDTQRSLGFLHFGERNWNEAHAAFDAAIDAGMILLAEAYTETGRRAEVASTWHFFACDAYCLLKRGNFADALMRVEQGKTRLLAEALALGGVDTSFCDEAQRQSLLEARRSVYELEAKMRASATAASHDDRDLAAALHRARTELNALIAKIRAERPEFMPTGLGLPELLTLIPAGGALVMPLITSQGSAIFVVPAGRESITEADILWLDSFVGSELADLFAGTRAVDSKLVNWLGAHTDHIREQKDWLQTIARTCQEIWDRLIGAVHERLSSLGVEEGATVLLMPQGGLGLLPLHAAWREVKGHKRYFLDDYTVIYAPSGYALSISQRRLQEPHRHDRSLLAVVHSSADLPFAAAEGDVLEKLFRPEKTIRLSNATPNAVVESIAGRAYLHFSCHGFYAWQNPMQSGLLLAHQVRLTLADVIAKLDLSASRLVTLAACETGMTDISQSPDEYLGLPAGFLQAGAPAVISTLWAVNDLSTFLLMERFYHYLLCDEHDAFAPAAALRSAQLWLRRLTAEELAARFELERRKPDQERIMSYEQSSAAWRRFVAMEPDARPFDNPYFWAAFTFSGV